MNRRALLIYFMLVMLGFSSSSFAADLTSAFTDAQSVFEDSLSGNQDATKAAIKKFEALVQKDPAQPLYLAYLGSTYTLKARDAWMPWTRLSNVEKGLGLIDKALFMLKPVHDTTGLRGSIISTETRLVAISTFLQVPDFLNRLQAAKDVLNETLSTAVFEASAPIVKGRLYMWAAEIAKREEEIAKERDFMEKALAVLPKGPFREQATQQLKGLTE